MSAERLDLPALREIQEKINRDVVRLAQIALTPPLFTEEPVAYDGFGAPLYAHQIGPEGTE